MLITEQVLDNWARSNAASRELVVELVWHLVAASVPAPRERRFPLDTNQPGPDGFLDSDLGFLPFVPEGRSYWEIGTSDNPSKKAQGDYKELTDALTAVPSNDCAESVFIFVTPLSGRKAPWLSSSKSTGRAAWVKKKLAEGVWKDVRVVDGAVLVDWLRHFPEVALWFAGEVLGAPALDLETPTGRWGTIRLIGDPPPLQPTLFLAGRDEACAKLASVLKGETKHLKLDTHFPDQVVDFVASYIASLDREAQVEAAGRCLIVSTEQAWRVAAALNVPHTLVAGNGIDLSGPGGTTLIQMARNKGHGVVLGGPKGGPPDPSRCALPSPSAEQVKSSLEGIGYTRERARVLAQKSDGNLPALLRCMQNLSVLPAWAEGAAAEDLAICALIGQWDESNPEDRAAVERLSGKAYGGWIATIREALSRPGTPLHHREGTWRFTSRYEGWHALGSRLFDEQIECFCKLAVEVLGHDDPALALPLTERYLAPIRGLRFQHSELLRQGLAGGLAMLGSYPEALTQCSTGRAAVCATMTVRSVLEPATWERWATLDRLLPLLAEASPTEFLDGLNRAIAGESRVFESLFGQEGDGITAGNYVSGVLWALETLAWSPRLLGRATLCLGELAARDPGGRWSNRPANTLRAIYLPWYPQTMASPEQQRAAIGSLKREHPAVAWTLSLALLPEHHGTAMGTAKPSWRNFIAEDWSEGTTWGIRWEQEEYALRLALELAGADPVRLIELIDRLGMLSEQGLDAVIARLTSPELVGLDEARRTTLWQAVEAEVLKHRKFADATWAMPAAPLGRLAEAASVLAPKAAALRHRRLFTERSFELYEGRSNYEEQQRRLELHRLTAVSEIAADGGPSAVLAFAENVDSPWLVGIAFGGAGSGDADRAFLPSLLGSEVGPAYSFLAGYVGTRLRLAGWDWVDSLPSSSWSTVERGRLLSLLPFDQPTWDRVSVLLGAEAAEYWTRTSAQPYHTDGDLAVGADGLVQHGRPRAALHCLHWLSKVKKRTDSARILRALEDALQSEDKGRVDGHEIAELFEALQEDPATDSEQLLLAEWAYVRVLIDAHGHVRPKTLEARLATDPAFFSEVVRLAFRSTKAGEGTDTKEEKSSQLALNAYSLLNHWRQVPGTIVGGILDTAVLLKWLGGVRIECKESGHLEIAMETVGRVLSHAPPDPTGLWIQRGVAEILDGPDAEDLRSGFRVQIYNSRGVHWVDPSGAGERSLAAGLRGKAAELEATGFHRFGATVRMIADGYDREADMMAARHAPEA